MPAGSEEAESERDGGGVVHRIVRRGQMEEEACGGWGVNLGLDWSRLIYMYVGSLVLGWV